MEPKNTVPTSHLIKKRNYRNYLVDNRFANLKNIENYHTNVRREHTAEEDDKFKTHNNLMNNIICLQAQ